MLNATNMQAVAGNSKNSGMRWQTYRRGKLQSWTIKKQFELLEHYRFEKLREIKIFTNPVTNERALAMVWFVSLIFWWEEEWILVRFGWDFDEILKRFPREIFKRDFQESLEKINWFIPGEKRGTWAKGWKRTLVVVSRRCLVDSMLTFIGVVILD